MSLAFDIRAAGAASLQRCRAVFLAVAAGGLVLTAAAALSQRIAGVAWGWPSVLAAFAAFGAAVLGWRAFGLAWRSREPVAMSCDVLCVDEEGAARWQAGQPLDAIAPARVAQGSAARQLPDGARRECGVQQLPAGVSEPQPVRIERWHAGARLVWLRLRVSSEDERRHDLFFWHSAHEAETWRRLRCWLLWQARGGVPGRAEPAPGSGAAQPSP